MLRISGLSSLSPIDPIARHSTAGKDLVTALEKDSFTVNRAIFGGEATREEIARLSPIRLPHPATPLAVAYGTGELPELRRQSLDFHASRAAAGGTGPLVPVERANHFDIMESLRAPDGELLATARRLLSPGP